MCLVRREHLGESVNTGHDCHLMRERTFELRQNTFDALPVAPAVRNVDVFGQHQGVLVKATGHAPASQSSHKSTNRTTSSVTMSLLRHQSVRVAGTPAAEVSAEPSEDENDDDDRDRIEVHAAPV